MLGNYKKVAVLNPNKELNFLTNQFQRVKIPLNLDFTPSLIYIGIFTNFLVPVYYAIGPDKKVEYTGDYLERCQIEVLNKDYVQIGGVFNHYQQSGTFKIYKIIAIE